MQHTAPLQAYAHHGPDALTHADQSSLDHAHAADLQAQLDLVREQLEARACDLRKAWDEIFNLRGELEAAKGRLAAYADFDKFAEGASKHFQSPVIKRRTAAEPLTPSEINAIVEDDIRAFEK